MSEASEALLAMIDRAIHDLPPSVELQVSFGIATGRPSEQSPRIVSRVRIVDRKPSPRFKEIERFGEMPPAPNRFDRRDVIAMNTAKMIEDVVNERWKQLRIDALLEDCGFPEGFDQR